MFRYIVKRVLLSIVTLWLLATIVFLMTWFLPSDSARLILGAQAPQASVAQFRIANGLNDPFLTQYFRLIKGLFTFDFGHSWKYPQFGVWEYLRSPLGKTAKIAILALIITTPISIGGGLIAAKYRDRKTDRFIVLFGLAASSIPEFVTCALLAVGVGLKLGWLAPVYSSNAERLSLFGQLQYLLIPAFALALAYFGYIARMMRAGTIQALDSDYVRTASMKGLSSGQVMRRHVLRNAVAPTITVMSVQVGYLISGILGVEYIYNYPGFSRVLLDASTQGDLPVLQVAVIISALVYMVATLFADLFIAWLNPRARLELGSS
ncbi:MAG TPA: ABC transporter permease [Ilumatobacteraceae bacterium]|mgnify:FL=1|nr:ABC transporter permease [Ilumatobacteraceae bacterium]